MKHSVEGKKVLVTGGTGFIGSGLVKGLLAAGAEVRSLDNDSRVAVARMDDCLLYTSPSPRDRG